MGKIRQLREDILLGNNSQDKIYPITYAKAVYMDNGKTAQEEIKSIEKGESLEENSITNRHIANGILTLDKMDEDLKVAIEAATGLPENMLERLQDLSESVAKLQDTTFPITLSLHVAFNDPNHTI